MKRPDTEVGREKPETKATEDPGAEAAWREFMEAAQGKTRRLLPVFVEFHPEKNHMHRGLLYISHPYSLATHLCCCGCGSEVVTPLGDGGWTYAMDRQKVTLDPSILNRPCGAHYRIRNGEIEWC